MDVYYSRREMISHLRTMFPPPPVDIQWITRWIDRQVPADVEPVMHGRWVSWTDDKADYLMCSRCGYGEEGEVRYGEGTRYCPYCGQKMDLDD